MRGYIWISSLKGFIQSQNSNLTKKKHNYNYKNTEAYYKLKVKRVDPMLFFSFSTISLVHISHMQQINIFLSKTHLTKTDLTTFPPGNGQSVDWQ